MQTRKTVEYDVKTPIQTVLGTMKSLCHADECARVSVKEEPDEIRKRIKRGGYNVKI